MNIKEIFKNKKVITSLAVTVLIIIFIIFAFNNRNDGMAQGGVVKTYYKVFTKEKKWSKWSKNGMTSGNDYSIRNIKIKCKKDSFSVMYYTDGDWSLKSNNKTINGIKIVNTGYFLEKYDVCYRTYNKKDKWLGWTCNGQISGNISENIEKIEIKTIPKDVVKKDYLKDYVSNDNESMIGF